MKKRFAFFSKRTFDGRSILSWTGASLLLAALCVPATVSAQDQDLPIGNGNTTISLSMPEQGVGLWKKPEMKGTNTTTSLRFTDVAAETTAPSSNNPVRLVSGSDTTFPKTTQNPLFKTPNSSSSSTETTPLPNTLAPISTMPKTTAPKSSVNTQTTAPKPSVNTQVPTPSSTPTLPSLPKNTVPMLPDTNARVGSEVKPLSSVTQPSKEQSVPLQSKTAPVTTPNSRLGSASPIGDSPLSADKNKIVPIDINKTKKPMPSNSTQSVFTRGSYSDDCPDPKSLPGIKDLSYKVTPKPGIFPESCPLPDENYNRTPPTPIAFTWKASNLCYKPLYFEDVQLERYGHTISPWLQPAISRVRFWLTIPVLPYLMGVNPPNECIYDLGYYRPGNCAPYMMNPVPISLRAGLIEAGVIVGGVYLIP